MNWNYLMETIFLNQKFLAIRSYRYRSRSKIKLLSSSTVCEVSGKLLDFAWQTGWSRRIISLFLFLQTPNALHLPNISSSNVNSTVQGDLCLKIQFCKTCCYSLLSRRAIWPECTSPCVPGSGRCPGWSSDPSRPCSPPPPSCTSHLTLSFSFSFSFAFSFSFSLLAPVFCFV